MTTKRTLTKLVAKVLLPVALATSPIYLSSCDPVTGLYTAMAICAAKHGTDENPFKGCYRELTGKPYGK